MGQKPDKIKGQSSTQDQKQQMNSLVQKFDKKDDLLQKLKFQIEQRKMNDTLSIERWGLQLNGEIIKDIGNVISSVSALRNLNLDLSINCLSENEGKELTKNFKNLKNLNVLYINLSENLLGDQGSTNFIEGISQCRELIILKIILGNNKIQGNRFLNSIHQNCKNLQDLRLYLQNNKISDEGIKQISQDLSSFKSINSLTLNFTKNNITDVESLGRAISQCENLQNFELILIQNKIKIESFNKFLVHFSNLSQLNSLALDITQNQITEESEDISLAGISQIKNLKELTFLFDNYKYFPFVSKCCKELQKLTNIRTLITTINFLAHRIDEKLSFIKEISKMQHLNYITINIGQRQYKDPFLEEKRIFYKQKRLVAFQIF